VDATILEIVRDDPRFAYEAYEFVCEAVQHTQDRLGRRRMTDPTAERHVTGAELLKGACDLAVREFGMMAPVVFKMWGVRTTDDLGEIVFKLIAAEKLSKSEQDDRDEFHDVFDLEKMLSVGFDLEPMAASGRKGSR
jgi:uncharacterized repeat protein (TIGR04138 family)